MKTGDRLLYTLGAMGLLQLVDGLLTYYLVNAGWAREINPLLTGIAGDTAFPFLKIAGALMCITALWLLAKRFRVLALSTAAVVVVFYAVVLGWNVQTLLGMA